MATDRILDMVGKPGGPLSDARLWHLEVAELNSLSQYFRRLTMTAPDLNGLRYTAGQDLMFRVPRRDEETTNRRYTIRQFDAGRSEVAIDVSLHGAGPGTDWARHAEVGDHIDAIGPRGKITPRLEAKWHLFIADDSGVPGALAMIEAIPATSPILALFEVETSEDEQEPGGPPMSQLEIEWIHRLERSVPGDQAPLLGALRELKLPPGHGHSYIAAESKVVRALQVLLIDRGFQPDQISAKSYWRRGLPNADHGEPVHEN